eukprot:1195203-Prorocentrum_minimum.AAC.3
MHVPQAGGGAGLSDVSRCLSLIGLPNHTGDRREAYAVRAAQYPYGDMPCHLKGGKRINGRGSWGRWTEDRGVGRCRLIADGISGLGNPVMKYKDVDVAPHPRISRYDNTFLATIRANLNR